MTMEKNNAHLSRHKHGKLFDLVLEICNYITSIESINDIEGIISAFVSKISETFNVGKVSCMLLDEATGELYIQAAIGLSPEAQDIRVKLGESFVGKVAKEGEPFLVDDIRTQFPELSEERLARYLTYSFLIVPLKIRDKVVGVLSLTDKKDSSTFTQDDLRTINFISQHLGLYIDNIRLVDKNKKLSVSDPLTNLFNHRYFQDQLSEEIYRSERYGRSLSLLMIDIDGFSVYNQTYGYPAGDIALQQIAKIINDNIRQVDAASRFGPEEFAVILPETRLKESLATAERIREKISFAVFTDDSQRKSALTMAKLTVSIGVTEHKIGLSKEELLQRLNNALVEAKKKGKNCVFAIK